MAQQAKRGFQPSDEKDFSENSLRILRKAAEEMFFLLNRGYPAASTSRFVGDRYQLSERQRLALIRTISPRNCILSRKSREVTEIAGDTLYIDGFNVIIGLEIAFSDSLLFRCMDGTIRDLAGLHGTYRLIPQTEQAVCALLKTLSELRVGKAVIYLDQPVSNSGKLRQKIYELAEHSGVILTVETENPVDAILKTKPLVASADAYVLDACGKWFNLAESVIRRELGEYHYTELFQQ